MIGQFVLLGFIFWAPLFSEAKQLKDDPPFTGCFSCASTKLKPLWYMTGLQLPSQYLGQSSSASDRFWNDDCDNPKNVPKSPCQDFCFSLKIKMVATDDDSWKGDLLVRGCHANFTNSVLKMPPTESGINCEAGSVWRFDAQNVAKETKATYSWCNVDKSQDPFMCNDNIEASCAPSTDKIKCNSCPDGSVCNRDKNTTGRYCTKIEAFIDGRKVVVRSSSDINPIYPGYGRKNPATVYQQQCALINHTRFDPIDANISYTGYTCFCNEADFCNSSLKNHWKFPILCFSFILLIFSKKMSP